MKLERKYGTMIAVYKYFAARADNCVEVDPDDGAFLLSWEEFEDFARACEIVSKPGAKTATEKYGGAPLNSAQLKLLFDVTNVELVADADNDDSSLVRFEFLEILVRAGIASGAPLASSARWL